MTVIVATRDRPARASQANLPNASPSRETGADRGSHRDALGQESPEDLVSDLAEDTREGTPLETGAPPALAEETSAATERSKHQKGVVPQSDAWTGNGVAAGRDIGIQTMIIVIGQWNRS